ncbi:MAG TPA: ABC transporter permease subunit [Pseudobacteroides sp.]|uniref:ABC transporter permease subunit n=1 Tax=Pseudobacteroides sp. TaxID=1968840 RepID=UPI002F933854
MTIFLRELKRYRKGFIIWTTCLVSSNVGMMLMYPTFANSPDQLQGYMKSLPKGMLRGLGIETLNLGQILDFFAYVFLYIILFGAAYAMLLGSSIISREESEKTIEFLLAKPVTRNGVITQKAMAVFFYITLFNIIFVVVDYFTFEGIKQSDYSISAFLLIHVGLYLLQLTFAAAGFFISIFVTKAKTIYPVTFGVVLGAFFINIVSAISDKLENLKYITPFNYVNPSNIVVNKTIEPVYIIIMLGIIVLSTILTYVAYNRKNISV